MIVRKSSSGCILCEYSFHYVSRNADLIKMYHFSRNQCVINRSTVT